VTPVDDATDRKTNETVNRQPDQRARRENRSPDIATVTILDNDSSSNLPILSITSSDSGRGGAGH